jgi:hypothetical protein
VWIYAWLTGIVALSACLEHELLSRLAEAVAQTRRGPSCLWADHNEITRGSDVGCETAVYPAFRIPHR